MKYFVILLVGLLLCQGCDKHEFNIDNLNNGKIDVIGHGGAGFQSVINPLPSNSYSSIIKALDALNADGVELDIKITSDSVTVLYHDDVLEKSTNCAGCPDNYLYQDFIKCKYKNYYGSRVFNEENLISFQQVIDHLKNRSRLSKIFASTKWPTVCTIDDPSSEDKYAKAMANFVKVNNASSWIYVYDSNQELLNKVRTYDPSIKLYYNAQEFEDGLNKVISNNYEGIVVETDFITKEQVKKAHLNNKRVIIWGVVTKKEIVDAVQKYPDGIMTDNISLTQEVLRK
jgi:glycerophosphoryl diester phosphodiesterase